MSEVELLLWLTGIHFVGLICVGLLMLPALREDNDPPAEDSGGGSDDGWGNQPNVKPDSGGWPGGGIPLPDAEQSKVRLREPGRIREKLPLPTRRPVREPERTPVPAAR